LTLVLYRRGLPRSCGAGEAQAVSAPQRDSERDLQECFRQKGFMFEPFESDRQIDKKKVTRNAAIARLAKFIEKHLCTTDWTLLADMAGVGHILDAPRHERVRRAQSFGDQDYPSAVSSFLQEVFDADEQIGLFLVGEIVQQENPYDDPLTEEAKGELTQILSMFGSEGIEAIVPNFPSPVTSTTAQSCPKPQAA